LDGAWYSNKNYYTMGMGESLLVGGRAHGRRRHDVFADPLYPLETTVDWAAAVAVHFAATPPLPFVVY